MTRNWPCPARRPAIKSRAADPRACDHDMAGAGKPLTPPHGTSPKDVAREAFVTAKVYPMGGAHPGKSGARRENDHLFGGQGDLQRRAFDNPQHVAALMP